MGNCFRMSEIACEIVSSAMLYTLKTAWGRIINLGGTQDFMASPRNLQRPLSRGNCSDWGRYGLGEDGIESMVRVASLQTPGAEQGSHEGSHDALGLAARCGAGTAADLAAHHRRTKAPLRRVVVRSRSWLNYEGEWLRQEAFHPLAQHPHGRIAAQVGLADGP